MKIIRKIFMPVFLALLILITTVPTYAANAQLAYQFTGMADDASAAQKANALHEMGLFAGTQPETYIPDLDSTISREQGITLAVRLMGLNASATALTDAEAKAALGKYSDFANVSDWAKRYVAEGIFSGIVKGTTDYCLKPKDDMTRKEFATLIVRTLGYPFSEAEDSNAAKSFTEIVSRFDTGNESIDNVSIKRSTAIEMSYGALGVQVNGSNSTLIKKLISAGVVDKEKAEKNGFQIETPQMYQPYIPTDTAVSFSSVELSALTDTTTQLKLTFGADPATLGISNISVTGATKVELSGTGNTRTLTVSDITVFDLNSISVSVSSPSGYTITPTSCSVSTGNLLSFTGTPATIGTALTVNGGSLDSSLTYNWYRSADNLWDYSDSMVNTGASYTPVDADAGKYLIVRGYLNFGDHNLVSTLATSEKLPS